MSSQDAPCRDCEFRQPACHGTCKVYEDWKRERENGHVLRMKDLQRIAGYVADDIYKRHKMFRQYTGRDS